VDRPWNRTFLGFPLTNAPGFPRAVAPKALRRFKEQVRKAAGRHRGLRLKRMIADINPVLRGWARHFGFSGRPRTGELGRLDQTTTRCVLWMQCRRARRPSARPAARAASAAAMRLRPANSTRAAPARAAGRNSPASSATSRPMGPAPPAGRDRALRGVIGIAGGAARPHNRPRVAGVLRSLFRKTSVWTATPSIDGDQMPIAATRPATRLEFRCAIHYDRGPAQRPLVESEACAR
jgi:Group II intron, maturase-specific domain